MKDENLKFTCNYCGEEITDFSHEDLFTTDVTTLLTECSRCHAIKQEALADPEYVKLCEKATSSNKNYRGGLICVWVFIGLGLLDLVFKFNSTYFSALCDFGALWGSFCLIVQTVIKVFRNTKLFNYEKNLIKNKLEEQEGDKKE